METRHEMYDRILSTPPRCPLTCVIHVQTLVVNSSPELAQLLAALLAALLAVYCGRWLFIITWEAPSGARGH
jgi:hypothetical protein